MISIDGLHSELGTVGRGSKGGAAAGARVSADMKQVLGRIRTYILLHFRNETFRG